MIKKRAGKSISHFISSLIKKYAIAFIVVSVLLGGILISIILSLQQSDNGEVDSHGCLVEAGYYWDETQEICIKDSEKEFCPSGSRDADVCIEIYNPVCGFPIKQSFSNSCFACLNRNVDYYIPGECEDE